MSEINVKNALKLILKDDEISRIDKAHLDLTLNLEEVIDIKNFINHIYSKSLNFKVAGSNRINDWEKGWSGDGVYFSDDKYNNLPYYFKNNTHIRLKEKVYKDINGFAEVDLLRAFQLFIFNTYLPKFNCSTICEYGCGTGSNISFLRENLTEIEFYGTDWAKSACENLIKNNILDKEYVYLTNFFDPKTYHCPPKNFIVFTNASLEQTGDNYKLFMKYLFNLDNCIGGIHIEPIKELLDLKVDLNKQSYDYSHKRGYLNDFYKFIKRNLSNNLMLSKDFGLGSKYISGYQVISWKK